MLGIERQHKVLSRGRVELRFFPGQRERAHQCGGAKRIVRQRGVGHVQQSPETLGQGPQLGVIAGIKALRDPVHQKMPLDLVHVQQGHADRSTRIIVRGRRPQNGQGSWHHRLHLVFNRFSQGNLQRAVEEVGLFVQHHARSAQVLRLGHVRPGIHQTEEVGAQGLEMFVLALGKVRQRVVDERAHMPQHHRSCGGIQVGGCRGWHLGNVRIIAT